VLVKTVKHVGVVPLRGAKGVTRELYDQARKEVGMLPEPVTMFSASPELLVATWAPFRESLLATGHAPRVVKEAVAAQVSSLNQCPYCVDAHTIFLYGGGAGALATSLLSGAAELDGDPHLRAVAGWAAANITRPAEALPAPFPPEQVPEIVGTLVEFHFLNRVIDVLLTGTFLPGSEKAHKVARKVAGKVFAKRVRAQRAPGASVGLTAGNPLPADLAWAAPQPAIAAAYANLAAAAGAAAQRVVTPAVANLVTGRVAQWDGRFPGPSKAWLDQATAGLADADQPAARLALLTALAPFQVTDDDVEDYREHRPTDAELLDLLTWAAFTAARTIGAWSVPTYSTIWPAA
jgi:AhpD family alkylhydroperoxidase